MATQNEEAKLKITLDIEESNKRLKELQGQMEKLRQSIKGTSDKGEKSALRKELEATQAEFKKTKSELGQRLDIIIDGKAAGASLNDLERAARKLKTELRSINPDSEEFRTGSARLRELRTNIDGLNRTLVPTKPLFEGMRNELKAFGAVAAGYLGFQFLTAQVSNVIRKNAELSDSLANIRQTAGLTEQEVIQLNKALGKIDTRTATADLREIAKVGGQFGVAKDELIGFTEAMNEATVVLKSEFKGGAEEITTTLSGLRNVLTDTKTANISEDLRKLG
ncbi:MAG: hypothetical protein ACEQSL_03610, partial [Sediminibacterium sp.]